MLSDFSRYFKVNLLRTGKIRKFKTGSKPLARFNLEAEAIHIFREVAAEAENPVFL